jgi:hypothetical protein
MTAPLADFAFVKIGSPEDQAFNVEKKACQLWHISAVVINGKKKTVDNSLDFAAIS